MLPARNARHGVLVTREGTIRIRNARYKADPRPPDSACGCPLCRRQSLAFLHHLTSSGEITAAVLATLHNLRYFLDFMGELREAIASRRLAELARSRVVRPADEDRSELPAAPPS